MTEQSTAVQTTEEKGLDLPTQNVVSIATIGEVERIEQTVVLPPVYQYAIRRGDSPKVMLTSDAYDYINRAMGVQLFQPTWVNDEKGNRVRNPIHRPDYIYLRLIGIWTNDLGQTVSYREDVEVDFNLVYHDARINSRSARVDVDDKGQPVFDENGLPIVRLSPDDELKALKALSQLRTFGLRYAQTVAKTRILKTASGIRTLPIASPRAYPIKVVGFRDRLTPDERIKRAQTGMEAMFGATEKLDENDGLTPEEMAQMQDLIGDDQTEDIERDLVEAAQDMSEAPDERQDISRIRRVGPTDLGLEDQPTGKR